MCNGASRARFVEKAIHDVAIGRVLGMQDLHRRHATDQVVLGAIHGTHAASAQHAGDLVATDDSANHYALMIQAETLEVK